MRHAVRDITEKKIGKKKQRIGRAPTYHLDLFECTFVCVCTFCVHVYSVAVWSSDANNGPVYDALVTGF